jgi:transposase InsO family protein
MAASTHPAIISEALIYSIYFRDVVLDAYVRWYNEKRIKGSLGYLSPIEYRESLGLAT